MIVKIGLTAAFACVGAKIGACTAPAKCADLEAGHTPYDDLILPIVLSELWCKEE